MGLSVALSRAGSVVSFLPTAALKVSGRSACRGLAFPKCLLVMIPRWMMVYTGHRIKPIDPDIHSDNCLVHPYYLRSISNNLDMGRQI